MTAAREAFIAQFDAWAAAYGVNPDAQLKPLDTRINLDPAPRPTTPEEALSLLRRGYNIYGYVKIETTSALGLATAAAQAQRAKADKAAGDDPDLWEAFSFIGLDPGDLPNWCGRTWADYVKTAYPDLVGPSGPK